MLRGGVLVLQQLLMLRWRLLMLQQLLLLGWRWAALGRDLSPCYVEGSRCTAAGRALKVGRWSRWWIWSLVLSIRQWHETGKYRNGKGFGSRHTLQRSGRVDSLGILGGKPLLRIARSGRRGRI